MATIKSYTDVEQSKKLAEILPFESADYHYIAQGEKSYFYPYSISSDAVKHYDKEIKYIPCWSLVALLGVFPKGINISTPKPINALGYCCWNQYDEIYADNPIDACYEMILKSHESNLL